MGPLVLLFLVLLIVAVVVPTLQVVALSCAIAVLLMILTKRDHEGYGGPIRNVQKIPFSNCVAICDNHYAHCMKDYGDVDPERCFRRYKEGCPAECYYSVSHQL